MVLNAIQKQISKQSLHKISSEAAVRRCSPKKLFLKIPHWCFPMNIAKIFKNSFFIENLWWLLFSVSWIYCSELGICRPSLLDQKHNVEWFLLKRFVDLFRVCYIISRNDSNTFLLINLQKTGFTELDILISAEVSLILRKFKLRQGNWQGKGFVLLNLCKYKRWRALLHRCDCEITITVCLLEVDKYERINAQNDYETTSKKMNR